MPRTFSESSAITIKLGWLVTIVGLLMSLAGSTAVLLYQVHDLGDQLDTMHQEQTANREAIISLTATLQAKEIIK